MGLLAKSINISTQKISFSQYTKKNNLSLCAVLCRFNQDFVITNAKGFDAISIISSVSSKDFWEGTIKEKNKWFSFTTSSQILPFFQFFSFNQKDWIRELHIFFTEDNKIFIVCSTEEKSFSPTDNMIRDFSSIDFTLQEKTDITSYSKEKNEVTRKYKLDFIEAVSKQLKNNLRNNLYKDILFNAISQDFLFLLQDFFPASNFVKQIEPGLYHLVFTSKKEISLPLLQKHLSCSFSKYLDEDSFLIQVLNQGKASSYKDLSYFLQA